MKNITINIHQPRLYFGLLLCCFAQVAIAKQPSLANYTTQTSHNCVVYECVKSLYDKNKLDVSHHKISPNQYTSLIEKHINAIQTTQTIYPGFNSTVLKKVPKNLKNKALHCHKSKAQKLTWDNPVQHSMVVKYRHECWQYRNEATHSDSHTHRAVERIPDIVYTIKITRQAAACSSPLYSIHPTKFECIAISKIIPTAKTVSRYSVLPLEAVQNLSSIKIKLDDGELEFVLLDLSDEGDLEDTVVTPTIVVLPEENGNNPEPNPGGESGPDDSEHEDSHDHSDSHDSEHDDDDHELDEQHHAGHPH